jgi:hypothetical protein
LCVRAAHIAVAQPALTIDAGFDPIKSGTFAHRQVIRPPATHGQQ